MRQITDQLELDFNTFSTKPPGSRRPRRFQAPGRAEGEDGCLGICLGVCTTRRDCPFLGCGASASGFSGRALH